MTTYTEDRFLDGKVLVRQPMAGFRSGLDAVMLAAAVPVEAGEECLELGAGAGAASLCLAQRAADCRIVGLEIDSALARLANDNARANGVEARVQILQGDVFALPQEFKRTFKHVFSNPPFHDGADGERPSDTARSTALHDDGRFRVWIETGAKRTASSGTFTVIIRADRLGEALSGLPHRGVTIFPLWPRAQVPAKRVILQLRKDLRAPGAVLPGLILHDDDGHFTPEANAILRCGASLALSGR
ncbi:MAG TPA: methyltransferase [Rhizomicrobium sp.]|nr:methyltransferase [Rhizomicrobium sp.]